MILGMTTEGSISVPQKELDRKPPYVIPASEIDLISVGKFIEGALTTYDREKNPHINWNYTGGCDSGRSLEWRDDGVDKDGNPIKTLFFWRGPWGGGGMEYFGLIVDTDSIAFVAPSTITDPDLLYVEFIHEGGNITKFKRPKTMFSELYLEAQRIADKSYQEYLEKRPPQA